MSHIGMGSYSSLHNEAISLIAHDSSPGTSFGWTQGHNIARVSGSRLDDMTAPAQVIQSNSKPIQEATHMYTQEAENTKYTHVATLDPGYVFNNHKDDVTVLSNQSHYCLE